MTALSGWENFYVIVGSSAGALIGLQFVVMSLLAGMALTRDDAHAGDTFTTPTVVHFGVVLLLSAVGTVRRRSGRTRANPGWGPSYQRRSPSSPAGRPRLPRCCASTWGRPTPPAVWGAPSGSSSRMNPHACQTPRHWSERAP